MKLILVAKIRTHAKEDVDCVQNVVGARAAVETQEKVNAKTHVKIADKWIVMGGIAETVIKNVRDLFTKYEYSQ